MGTVDRKLELFDHVARLRRAGREMPGSADISAVRAALERELGETLSLRLAARILGVSHTALARWIDAGDVPVVLTPSGRKEVPVAALLDLRESVDADRADGVPRRYALKPTIDRQRAAADRLPVASVDTGDAHDRARARSLAYHRAIAARLRRPMVNEARHVLSGWRDEGRIDPRYAATWERLLNRPLPEIRTALVAEDSDADDLRQNSPFAGMLSEPERRRILRAVA